MGITGRTVYCLYRMLTLHLQVMRGYDCVQQVHATRRIVIIPARFAKLRGFVRVALSDGFDNPFVHDRFFRIYQYFEKDVTPDYAAGRTSQL